MALTALLMAFYCQSKRRTADFLGTLLGQPCCPSLTVKIQNQVTAAVRPSYEALAAQLPAQERLSIDETGTKEANGKAWLWTFVAGMFTVFAVRATREATALRTFLGEAFRGIVNCDRAKMYWHLGCLRWFWAHLNRDFRAMIDSGDKRAKHLGFRRGTRRASCSSTGPTIAPERSRARRSCVGGPRPSQGGVFAVARHAMWLRRHARHVPGTVRTPPVAVDVLASRRDRTDEQCGRAVVASCGDLAETLLWDQGQR